MTFKIPYAGQVLTRSYSLASSPDVDRHHKVTVKRVANGRISNWMNDRVEVGTRLMVVPPAGSFALDDADRKIILFGGGSGSGNELIGTFYDLKQRQDGKLTSLGKAVEEEIEKAAEMILAAIRR